jgi:hypothetical protein
VTGQRRGLRHRQQRLHAVAGLEGEFQPAGVQHLDAADILVKALEERPPVLLDRVEGELEIVGGDRLAVVPAGLGPKVEDDPALVVRILGAFGDQAVSG